MVNIQAEFSRRWWRQLAVTPFVLFAMWPMITRDRHAPVDPLVLTLFVITMLATFGFSLWNWRCPACNGYLGRSFWFVRHCRHCGAQLA